MKHVLPNGLTLLLEPDPHAQSVAAGYFVNTGARDELPEQMGVSHFLEHLMFKGSDALNAVTLNERLDDLGGYTNAFTSEEITAYHAAALPERLPELLDTLTQLMRPALRESDLQAERGVILEEIAMYADQPSYRVVDELRRDYYGPHSLGHRVLGTAETVTSLTREQVAASYAARYGASQVTFVLVGAFDPLTVLEWAGRELVNWPAGGALPVAAPPVPTHGRQVRETFRRIQDAHLHRAQVALATPGLSARHPLREAAFVLADLIGGEGGALYWALVDNGLADSADLGHLDYRDSGVFEGGFSCDPARLETAQAAFMTVLRGADRLITDAAVRRAARKAAVATLLRAETPQGRLFTLGMEYLALGEELTTVELAARFTAVTPEDVREVLRLCPLKTVTGVVLTP